MARGRLDRLRDASAYYQLTVETWAPGDGVRRFNFHNAAMHIVGGVKGIGNAERWLDAFGQGYLAHERKQLAEEEASAIFALALDDPKAVFTDPDVPSDYDQSYVDHYNDLSKDIGE